MSSDVNDNQRTGMKAWVKVLIGVLVVAVLAGVGGPFVYINFIKDDPKPRLSLDDAPATEETTSPTSAGSTTTAVTETATDDSTSSTNTPTTNSAGTPTTTADTAAPTTAAPALTADGTYVLTPDSQAGYRVVEVLLGQDTEGVGRTNSVTGSVTVSGTQVTAAEFTVDMATLVSDEEHRDSQFKNEIMETSEFPTGSFVITQPIELGAIPVDGEELTASATGNLTLHGVTKPVTLEVRAKKTGSSIAIVGSTDVVFADYDIANPSNGAVTTQDHGLVEFLLVAVAA